jgi:hypothetical protein
MYDGNRKILEHGIKYSMNQYDSTPYAWIKLVRKQTNVEKIFNRAHTIRLGVQSTVFDWVLEY